MAFNMKTAKTESPLLDLKLRKTSFEEVDLGYTLELAIEEASRCLNCVNKPCVSACPVEIDIPKFINKIRDEDLLAAAKIILEESSLPSVCGRVCPQENQCESRCVRLKNGQAVAIGKLERFVGDFALNNDLNDSISESNNIRVAVIGSGPSGLAAASELAKNGYKVTVFEALHKLGGVLTYGIPDFRLPSDVIEKEINRLKSSGVEFITNILVGKTLSLADLFEQDFKAVFIGIGAGLPKFMGIPGENLNGVYSANEYLTRVNLMKSYMNSDTPIYVGKKVAIVGGGNVAMDAARTALRLGAEEVSIIYRRTFDEMPARLEERIHAKEEGINFRLLQNPLELLGNSQGKLVGLKLQYMELSEPDESGRKKPIPIKEKEEIIEIDTFIESIGMSPNIQFRKNEKLLNTLPDGRITVLDDNGKTSIDYVYAGGDIVTGAATVIKAMGAGKKAAKAIHELLKTIRK